MITYYIFYTADDGQKLRQGIPGDVSVEQACRLALERFGIARAQITSIERHEWDLKTNDKTRTRLEIPPLTPAPTPPPHYLAERIGLERDKEWWQQGGVWWWLFLPIKLFMILCFLWVLGNILSFIF